MLGPVLMKAAVPCQRNGVRFASFVCRPSFGLMLQQTAEATNQDPIAEAVAYKEKYWNAFQYFQARCQHHMHPMSSVTNTRTVPHACRRAGVGKKKIECKHGAPWLERLNLKKPSLLCKKIAKKRELRCSGNRNVLGTLLGLRNDQWSGLTVSSVRWDDSSISSSCPILLQVLCSSQS